MAPDPSGLMRLCSYCEREASAVCQRCGVAICRAHTPTWDRRCEECEAEYQAARSTRFALHGVATAGIVAVLLGLVFLFAVGKELVLMPLILFSAVPITLFKLELRSRRRFLDETSPRNLPAARALES